MKVVVFLTYFIFAVVGLGLGSLLTAVATYKMDLFMLPFSCILLIAGYQSIKTLLAFNNIDKSLR